MDEACGMHGENMNEYRALVGKLEGKRPIRRPTRRREDNIKMVFKEIGLGAMDFIHLSPDRDQNQFLANLVMNLRFLLHVGQFLSVEEMWDSDDGLGSMELVHCQRTLPRFL
jgi:hypothetical protein